MFCRSGKEHELICNFHCLHCQNYDISQYPHFHNGEIAGAERTAEVVIDDAVRTGCTSVCYTYVEPNAINLRINMTHM